MTLESINRQPCDERDAYRSAALGLKARVAELEAQLGDARSDLALAGAAEREACAVLAQECDCAAINPSWAAAQSAIAGAIRARGSR